MHYELQINDRDSLIDLDPFDFFTDYAEYYLSKNRNELYCVIGNSLLLSDSSLAKNLNKISINPFDTTNLLGYQRGKVFFKSIKANIYHYLCKDWNFCEKINFSHNNIELVIDISHVLASKIQGVPIFAVSALLVKEDAKSFCNDCQRKDAVSDEM
jgi:hypothetical protein